MSSDFKRAAERFDVATQVAHMHVSTLFKLPYGRLPHRERFDHFILREGTRLAQLFRTLRRQRQLACIESPSATRRLS